MAVMTDKIIPSMVTSVTHDKVLKVTYPLYRIVNRSYNEVARLIEAGHRVELNDQGMIVVLDKDKLVNQIAPLYNIQLGVIKEKETTTGNETVGSNSNVSTQTGPIQTNGSTGSKTAVDTKEEKKDEKVSK